MQNLIRIKEKDICKNVQALLLEGETIVGAYKTVRDQAVFTSHRIFLVDMQGVTGTRQEIFVLPYKKVLHFGIQTWPVPSAAASCKGENAQSARSGF